MGMNYDIAISWQEAFRKTYHGFPAEAEEATTFTIQELSARKPKVPVKTNEGHYACTCGLIVMSNGIRRCLHYCNNCGSGIDWEGLQEQIKGEKYAGNAGNSEKSEPV